MRTEDQESGNNFTLLRLSLALMVVFGHFKLLSGTQVPPFPYNLADSAVFAFFVVSGYLIAGSYERSRTLRSFYVRRVFRLYPMYLCVVVLQALLMMALLPDGFFSAPQSALRYIAVNAAFANFLQYDIGGVLSGLHNPGINPSLWTLKIEIGFYLIVPFIFMATKRLGWWVLAAVFVASLAYNLAFADAGAERLAKQLPGQLQYFVVGMALYLYGHRIRMGAVTACLVPVAFLAAWTFLWPLPPVVAPLFVGAFVFAVALRAPVVPFHRDISYSVYLVHGPIIQTLILTGLFHDTLPVLAAVVAGVIGLSLVTEHLVERPGNTFGRRLSALLSKRPAPLPNAANVA